MDPIFTNLPYSTNIEEDVPLVSVVVRPHATLLVYWNSVAEIFQFSSLHSSSSVPFAPPSPSSFIILYKWCKIKKVKIEVRAVIRAECVLPLFNPVLLWPLDPSNSDSPRALTYSTAGAGDCNYCGRFTILLRGCEAFTKGHWSLSDLSPLANLYTSCMWGMKCASCVKNKRVGVTIILPFVFIASSFCNVLSASFHLRHYAPSLDSSLTLLPGG